MSKIPQDKENGLKQENDQSLKQDFIREKIVKRPLTWKKLLFSMLTTVVTAIVFGVIACVTFVGFQPLVKNILNNKETESSLIETAQTDSVSLESETAKENQTLVDELDSNKLEEIVLQYLEQNKLQVKDYSDLYDSISKLTQKISKSLVKVTAVTQDIDWFEDSYEKEGTVSGFILEIKKKEIVIVTDYSIVKQADQVKVTFVDDSQATARIVSLNKTEGLSLIKVQRADISETTVSQIKQVTVDDSDEMITQGTPILAMGSPNGSIGSMEIGYVTLILQNSQAVDGMNVVIDTNISVNGSGNSWIFGMNGKLLGIYQSSLSDGVTSQAISVTSVFDEIEKMKEQKNLPCLGVYGQDVTKDISTKYNLPYGIYVTSVVEKGTAYKAGLQNGDVITNVDGQSILTLQELKNEILKKQSGDEITLTIQRSGADGYKEIELSAKLGKR